MNTKVDIVTKKKTTTTTKPVKLLLNNYMQVYQSQCEEKFVKQ